MSELAKPSIVLVHGLWADASSFNRIIPVLQEEGHEVFAPQFGLDTLAGDVDAVKRAFTNEGFGYSLDVYVVSRELAGLRLAAKDVLNVAGLRMGAGNPTWHAPEAPARSTAFVIRTLLSCGA